VALSKKHGVEARELAERLVSMGWSVVDVVHAVRRAVEVHEWAGLLGIEPLPKPALPPRCRCGDPLARRINATCCGRGRCRTRRHRVKRRRTDGPRWVHLTPAQKAARRIRRFFSALLSAHRWHPFSEVAARALGAQFGVPPTAVDETLRELVEEDGSAFVLVGTKSVYGFMPPHARRAA
jgi:hypothetical protein